MSKISRSINKLKKRILSSSASENLFSTTKNPIFLTGTLTSKQSIFSNSSSISLNKIHNANFNSSHGGARRIFGHQSQIDLIGLMSENQANLIPHTPGMSNYAVLRFLNTNSFNPLRNLDAKLSGSGYSYIVVFPYGSAVMFNMLDHEVGRYLKIIKRHASGLQKTWKGGGDYLHHYIDYEVRENQGLPTWMQGGLNCMLLQQLDIDGICTVGSILGQSVALDYYSRLVDQWVKEYSSVNYGLEKRGSISSWIKLFKHSRRRAPDYLGLSERSAIAWKGDTKYAQMLDYLRDEFQLTQRFAGLDRKFKMGENNFHFVGMQLVELCTHAGLCVYLILFVLISFSPIGGLPFSSLETCLMSL
ncbi:hypothetical protein MKW98_015897 [Papaver atlanticum]|uniref:DUF155 domain-containing protein n=1 Tax=Papaver atlanticum TaxID=357466 RepID=A0AAD4XKM8_9MAGN|nr:hypothetical protein MKW98_015897 [Papaver atlanticum]